MLHPHQEYDKEKNVVKNIKTLVTTKLSNPWIHISSQHKKLILCVNTNKRRILDSCYKTWQSAINTNAKCGSYSLKIEAKSSHFPIFLIADARGIRVRNYLGLKCELLIPISNTTKLTRYDDCTLIATEQDSVKLGSLIGRLLTFYKRTHHKFLDRRVFVDRFVLTKSYEE